MVVLSLIVSFLFSHSSHDSRAFESYLKQNQLPVEEHQVYIVISGNTCVACSNTTRATLMRYSSCSNLVVITGDRMVKEDLEGKAVSVLFDEAFDFDYLPYNFTYTSIVKIEGEKLELESFGVLDGDRFERQVSHYCE
ncbi:hypothetical protein [Croceimicrobium hydrocarbonivorans]|uniref:Uncharacterized protein n=1 Tax=Croceimicrobium hydrocarbonivorans TaxID=2761580 RepID=A0A7H0VCL1_9FLAO|nr:hypothetical protein [Croceimicrobium hydrocarbonivorans]QNR23459.1 hypothetical protein H4K34_13885 [Croceimicrobium hydrocarbonivorans]